MALRKIARLGEPVLRARALEVSAQELASPSFQSFLDDLIETCRDAEGVGIAAPQVFESKRVFVIEVRGDRRYANAQVFPLLLAINPEIELLGDDRLVFEEGCLSIPDLRGEVSRSRRVRLVAQDRDGQRFERELEGFPAVIAQHEFDHLEGIVFLDRMTDLKTLAFEREARRRRAANPELSA